MNMNILTAAKLSATQRMYTIYVDAVEFHHEPVVEMIIIADEFMFDNMEVPTYATAKEAYDAACAMVAQPDDEYDQPMTCADDWYGFENDLRP